jgi:ubiquinone/menaquinone biosynthesis C-methylase UbiE
VSDFIKQFWDAQAEEHGTGATASWGDEFAVGLEVETIGGCIPAGARVLDVGCANGHATLRYLEHGAAEVVGVDYSEPMIDQAQRARDAAGDPDKITFRVGDVRHLDFPDDSFDFVCTTRVLINLPNWAEQARGVRECLRVCRPGGTVVLSEAFWEPLMRLNAMRALVQLPPLVEHDFNRYLKRPALETLLAEAGLEYEVKDFSSVYYLGSRFLRELVTVPEDYPGYSNPINRIFFDIAREYSGGGFGIQMAYVIRP